MTPSPTAEHRSEGIIYRNNLCVSSRFDWGPSSPPPPKRGRGHEGRSAALLDVLEGEQAERVLHEPADFLAADVAIGAVVEIDEIDVVLRHLLQVDVHLLALGGIALNPRIRDQLLHLVVLVTGEEVEVGIVAEGEGHLLVRV